uniref:Carboxypeptidase regulatory-like domain-containing protein n=1 Tax=Roseihalotalea indica TaxID=2867963 RepID=A0AA49GQ48_9BACT|nr:carboxypeptidase regulatory-like domain-containing protein [Tunicatimonas sp. TK19036]
MMKKTLTLIAVVIMSCQNVPSASVPEADSSPIQFLKTSLQVTVRDNIGNVVEGAEVQLFTSKEDYQKETNPVGEKVYTDDKGRAKYIGLDARDYFVNVEKGDLNNFGAGIKTDSLVEKRMNKVTIIIE